MSIGRIAVLTSGGDAPGMNAAVRSVVRTASFLGAETLGVQRGFEGLMTGNFVPLDNRAVGGIMQRGGTMLGSARAPEFADPTGCACAIQHLQDQVVQGLIVIGGNGSQAGGLSLHLAGFPVVGVASTIDNDISCVDTCIGVDTALNTALSMVDRLRDTATSHHRAFVVEVMGRKSGYLALMTGIACGAEIICTPEHPISLDEIVSIVKHENERGKSHVLVINAEGHPTSSGDIVAAMQQDGSYETRLSILGHVQRGGPPLAFDRLLASRSAERATEALIREGESGVVAGLAQGRYNLVSCSEAIIPTSKVTPELLLLAKVLSQ